MRKQIAGEQEWHGWATIGATIKRNGSLSKEHWILQSCLKYHYQIATLVTPMYFLPIIFILKTYCWDSCLTRALNDPPSSDFLEKRFSYRARDRGRY